MPAAAASSTGSSTRWRPGVGILKDVTERVLPHYRGDWAQGLNWGTRILPPSTYTFFASVLPALAFGQQLAMDTDGTLNVVHVLVSTALAGVVQAVVGGQPLLIIGVAEPIVIIYGFMHSFARSAPGLGAHLFLPWAAWVCIWTSVLCCVLALLGACEGINYFTRFSGELFGALIAILFLQVGIKGMVHEFYPAEGAAGAAEPWQLTLINGLWSLLLSLALLLSCLAILKARAWRLGRGWLRGLLADYGVPLMVVLWSGASFAVSPAPHVPRRVTTPNTWEVWDTWSVAMRLGEVPGSYVAAALVPAVIITVLFFFDHNVSSQLAQQPEFNLAKGPAYHWDFLLLSLLTLVCGLLGLPPVNGVLPQAPMHTRSLAHIRTQHPAAGKEEAKPADAADVACTIHSSTDSESDWVADSQDDVAPAAGAAGVAAATQSLSQLQLGAAAHDRQRAHSTAGSCWQQHPQEGVHVMTAALSHMHLDTPGPPHESGDSSFGTPTACAARQPVALTFQQASGAAISHSTALGSSYDGAGLRHRQRSLSPTDTAAAGSSAPQRRRQHRREGSLELQQPRQQDSRPGRLRPSGSDMAINTLPDSAGLGPATHPDQLPTEEACGTYLRLEVREQRVSNLLQSLLVAACLGITPAIQQIPTGVLWGYFCFMAIKSLEGSQLWERLLLLLTDPKKRVDIMQQEHAAYMQLVPYRVVVRFTLLQLLYLLGVWALTTWAGIAGVAFPLPIMALVPLRQFVLPRLFERSHLSQLDAAEYEEAPPVPDKLRAAQELYELGAIAEAPAPELPTASPGPGQAGGVWGEDEAEVVSREFHGLQIKHHLSRESLEQQQQQLRRRERQP